MEVEQKSLKKNIIMSTILTLSNFLFPLLTFTHVSRALMPTGLGKVAFASSILSYLSYISILGMSTYGPRECAKVRDNREELCHLTQELLIINVLTTIIAYVLFIALLAAVPRIREDKILFIVMSSVLFLKTIGLEWLYQALEEYSYITKRSLAFKSISVVLTFLLIHNPDDYIKYGLLSIFTSSASYICNFIRAREFVFSKKRKPYNLKKHIKPMLVLLSASVIVTIYANFDIVMLGFIKTDYEIGLYNVSLKIKNVVLALSTALADVLITRISYYYAKKQDDKIKELILKSCRISLLIAVPVTVYILIFSEQIILFMCGDNYLEAKSTLIILMFCVFPLIMTYIFGQQLLIPLNKERVYTKSVFCGMIINVLLNVLLIPFYGSFGAAVGTLFTEMWNMLYMGHSVKEYRKYIMKKIDIYRYLIGILISSFFTCFVNLLIPKEINTIWILTSTSISFFGIYYFTLILEKEPLIISEIKRICYKYGKKRYEN